MDPGMDSVNTSVLCVGDRFVPASLLAARVRRRAGAAGLRVAIRELDLPYPSARAIPVPRNAGPEGLRAFWEDVDGIASRLQADDEADPTIREYTGPADGLVPEVGGVEVLLVHAAPVSRAAVQAARSLRVVGSVRTGPVNVNVEALSARGIPLFNCPGRNATAVAEFVAGALLGHVRGIVESSRRLGEGEWSLAPWHMDSAGIELHGKTCGLVGFGQVGRAFAPIARGLGMSLVVSDPFVDSGEIRAAGAAPASLEDLLVQADVVVVMARLTSGNRHLIDRAALARMRPWAILVNTARSQLVDTHALADALRRGAIAGAVVDVHDQEPLPPTHPLLDAPNVLLTPHIAGATRDTVLRGAEMIADSVVGFLSDGSMEHCVNAAAVAGARSGAGHPGGRS
jgi:D-3-phosphoglycerate dehydrogenase